jgi:hypothetical protein
LADQFPALDDAMAVRVSGQHDGVIGVLGLIGMNQKRAQRAEPESARKRRPHDQRRQDNK